MSATEADVLAAHAAGDLPALVTLYSEAAATAEDPDAAAFLLTHAYVFALEAGHPGADDLHAALVAAGREAPLPPARPKPR